MSSPMSFMDNRNIKGPKTVPCGISTCTIQMNPVITRVFYIYINVAIPILNPLVVLLGNRKIRKKAIGLKKFQTSNKINYVLSPLSDGKYEYGCMECGIYTNRKYI
jgi:hypothetical protein